jgi:predicted peptidase
VLREGTIGNPGIDGYRRLVHVPRARGRRGGQGLPLVLFLHGSAERGSDPWEVARNGPPQRVARGDELPFILVAPQCPAGRRWSVRALAALLDRAIEAYGADPDRVSLTGLSLGAEAAWALALFRPWRFAAIATVCGGGDATRAHRLAGVPCRVYHGSADAQVPLRDSAAMVEALQAAGGDVRFTVYHGADHDAAIRMAYDDPELYRFLWTARRRPEAPDRKGRGGASGPARALATPGARKPRQTATGAGSAGGPAVASRPRRE